MWSWQTGGRRGENAERTRRSKSQETQHQPESEFNMEVTKGSSEEAVIQPILIYHWVQVRSRWPDEKQMWGGRGQSRDEEKGLKKTGHVYNYKSYNPGSSIHKWYPTTLGSESPLKTAERKCNRRKERMAQAKGHFHRDNKMFIIIGYRGGTVIWQPNGRRDIQIDRLLIGLSWFICWWINTDLCSIP